MKLRFPGFMLIFCQMMQFMELEPEDTSMRYRAQPASSSRRAMQGCFGFNLRYFGKSI
jgi:hypothetical protein